MTNRVLAILFTCIIVSCGQEEEKPAEKKTTSQDCITLRGENHGRIVEGQFIIVTDNYSSNISGRSKPHNIARIMEDHKIPSQKIKAIIKGEEEIYVASLSHAEHEALKNQKELIIEPDRYVSMSACFSVVEPRLVTWNVNTVGYSDGQGKTAWIIDTGIDLDHPDLNVDKTKSKSFIEGESVKDENGHGTHIAGVIGALNNDIGTLGVASGATIVGLKVLNKDGEGLLSNVLKALSYIRQNGAAGDVINISLGVDDVSEIIENEIRALGEKGVYIVIAAGNNEKPARSYSPGRTNGLNIYTISAVDSLDNFASFSNFGNDVIDYAAPGVRILSTYKDKKYAIMSGTSMASPHVAGLLLINSGKINSLRFAKKDPDGTPDPIAHQ